MIGERQRKGTFVGVQGVRQCKSRGDPPEVVSQRLLLDSLGNLPEHPVADLQVHRLRMT